jgi:hypothetical protein
VLGLVLTLAVAGGAAAGALEICGNCLDDDGDGAVDLGDADCCAAARTAPMALLAGTIAPGRETSGLRLAGRLAPGAALSPGGQQVLLQLGTAPGATFCASMPPSAFRGTARRLRLARGPVPGARGVRRMLLCRTRDGTVRWRAAGRRVGFTAEGSAGTVDVLLLLADGTDPAAAPRCFAARAAFRPGRHGTLVVP